MTPSKGPQPWAVALLLAAGFWARCARFREVFTSDAGLQLVPSDSHYYVRFGLLQLGHFPHFRAFDAFLNHPVGAFNLWPPFHAWLITFAIWIGGAPNAELAAAWVGPVVGTLELAVLIIAAGRFLGARRAFEVGWLYALTPVLVWAGGLGNADHHVHEGFIAAFAALTAGEALATGRLDAAVACGVVLGLGRMFTTSAFAVIPAIALAWPCAVWAGTRAPGATLRVGSTLAGVTVGVLALSVVLFGRPSSLEYQDVSSFHPLFAAVAFAGALALMALRGRRWPAVGLLLGVALVAALPLGFELRRMLGHLERVDAALAWVDESTPLLKEPRWALSLLGVTLLALPLGGWGAVRSVRFGESRWIPAVLCVAAFTVAAALQARFSQALAGGLAVLLPGALAVLLDGRRAVWSTVAVVSGLTLAGSLIPERPEPTPDVVAKVKPTLIWMRTGLPPAVADPFGDAQPAYGVAGSPLIGNFVMLWAERPTVALMRSQARVHDEGLIRNGALLASLDDDDAYAQARASGVRYLVTIPSEKPIGTLVAWDSERSLLPFLENHAGVDAEQPERTTGHFALVHESEEQRRAPKVGSYTRVFEVRAGAVIEGQVDPGARVEVRSMIALPPRSSVDYRKSAVADPAGHLALRVPYAGRYHVTIGTQVADVDVAEADVAEGRAVELQ